MFNPAPDTPTRLALVNKYIEDFMTAKGDKPITIDNRPLSMLEQQIYAIVPEDVRTKYLNLV